MTEKELKNHLNSFTADIDVSAKKKTLQSAVACSQKQFKPISLNRFILNQLHFIKPLHPILCLLFIILTPILAAAVNRLQLILFISLFVPMLSCVTVPNLLSRLNAGMMELESSTLYRAGTVFSARLMIYGAINSMAILISALITAPFTGNFLWLLLFEINLFTISAFISLLLSLIIRSQYAAVLAAVLNVMFAYGLYSFITQSLRITFFTGSFSLTSIVKPGILGITAVISMLLLFAFLWLLHRIYHLNGELLWKLNY